MRTIRGRVILLAVGMALALSWAARADDPPNVIIVFADDQGYGDLSCYGHPTIHTPHIDRLAAEGMKLTQFYVASPVCSPSRAALLTGCYPKRIGMEKHVVFPPDAWGLHTDEVTIADMLRGQGYATGCFGKWHLGHRRGVLPTDQGFDEFFGVPYSNDMSRFHRAESDAYPHGLPLMRDETVLEWEPDQHELSRRYTEAAVDFIDRHHEGPFFVYLPHSMPHIPIYASKAFEGTSPRGLYGDVIEEIDWSVGQLRGALERHGVADNTLVIFTSDNGPWLPFKAHGGTAGSLRGGKGSNWEGGQRVPCVAWWPERIPAGSMCRAVATTMDLLPTLARLSGTTLETRGPIDGHDITDLLTGTTHASPTDAFLYYTSRGVLAGIRRGPWKLLLERGELYDVEVDISEKWNRSADHPSVVEDLRSLATARDAAISEQVRPRLTVADPLLVNPRASGGSAND